MKIFIVAVQRGEPMSDLWKYTEACDGDYCPQDCDHCNREDEDDDDMLSMPERREQQ